MTTAIYKGTIPHDLHDQISSMANGCEVYENEEHLEPDPNFDPPIKEEPLSEEEGTVDLPMDCVLCTKQFNTLSGLKAHVITHHNYKSVKRKSDGSVSPAKRVSGDGTIVKYTCDICKRKFTTSTDLKVHEVCHDKFTCFACGAKFNTFNEVADHRRRCGAGTPRAPGGVKPKTLTDILKDRLAQKQSEDIKKANASHSDSSKSDDELSENDDSTKVMVEVEIDMKRVIDGKVKTEIDYKKIETELESIFESADENTSPNVSIDKINSDEISKENKPPTMKDTEELTNININTARLDLNEKVVDTMDSKENSKDLNEVNAPKDLNSNAMDENNKEIDGNLQLCKEVNDTEKPQIEEPTPRQPSEISNVDQQTSDKNDDMDKDTLVNNNQVDNTNGAKVKEINNVESESGQEDCKDSKTNLKTESGKEANIEIKTEL